MMTPEETPQQSGPASVDVAAELLAAPACSVVETGRPLGDRPVYVIFHYEYGINVGRSLARGDEIASWVADLRGAGHQVRLGWELRSEPAPDGWPHEAPGGEG